MNKAVKIIQNAYVVDSLEEAAKKWWYSFGIGPFVLLDRFSLESVDYRGRCVGIDMSIAVAQSGELNIELIEQHSNSDSAYRDMFPRGTEGLHHVAYVSESYFDDIARFKQNGFECAMMFKGARGRSAAYIDTRPLLGHMIELYESSEVIEPALKKIEVMTEKWDGRSPLI